MQRKGLETNVITFCALISACAKGHNIAEKTSQLLVGMLWKGLEPNLITHNVPISACKGRTCREDFAALEEMQRMGLEPGVITHNTLIKSCAKGDNNAEKTLQLFVELQRKGLEPNGITYNALVSACAKGEHLEKALQPLAEMQRNG